MISPIPCLLLLHPSLASSSRARSSHPPLLTSSFLITMVSSCVRLLCRLPRLTSSPAPPETHRPRACLPRLTSTTGVTQHSPYCRHFHTPHPRPTSASALVLHLHLIKLERVGEKNELTECNDYINLHGSAHFPRSLHLPHPRPLHTHLLLVCTTHSPARPYHTPLLGRTMLTSLPAPHIHLLAGAPHIPPPAGAHIHLRTGTRTHFLAGAPYSPPPTSNHSA